MPVALITGVMGQDGRCLADWLLARGYQVHGTTRRLTEKSDMFARQNKIAMHCLALDQPEAIGEMVATLRFDEIYHLAARSSSSQLADDPAASAHVNGLSVLHFLEALRKFNRPCKFAFASSSEVFAGTDTTPQSEKTLVVPLNPYGITKNLGMQWVRYYRETHQLFACSAILYNHESIYRGDHYVTRKITNAAAQIYLEKMKSVTLGNLDSQRDWMHAKDAVRGLWAMLQAKVADDYVFGSGLLHSVRDVCDIAFSHLGLDYRDYVISQPDAQRREERVQLRADIRKSHAMLCWQPEIGFTQMIQDMVDFDVQQHNKQ